MLTSVKTSRRQGQSREGVSEGSLSAKRRADEQKPDIRPSSRVEWAPDYKDQQSALYGKSGGCVVTVHVLIRGDLSHVRWVLLGESNCGPVRKDWNNHRTYGDTRSAPCGNAWRDETEVSRRHSSQMATVMGGTR